MSQKSALKIAAFRVSDWLRSATAWALWRGPFLPLFHQSHSLHGHLGWPRHTCPLCVLELTDIASFLVSLLTILCSVDMTSRHLLLFCCIVIITQCFLSLSVHALLVRLKMNLATLAHSTVNRYCCHWNNLNHE